MGKSHKTDAIQGQIVHEYDGIEEADNDLPNWWLMTFYVAIFFAVGYWFYYHEFEISPLPRDAYLAELSEAASNGGEVSDEGLMAMAEDRDVVAAGRGLYEGNCVPCHGPTGGGVIGPNLTDRYWIHGGEPSSIHNTIADGVGSAGMPSWSGPLGPAGVQQVTAYVLSIRNTEVEGGKEAQGDLYDPNAAAEEEGAEENSEESANEEEDSEEGVEIDGNSEEGAEEVGAEGVDTEGAELDENQAEETGDEEAPEE